LVCLVGFVWWVVCVGVVFFNMSIDRDWASESWDETPDPCIIKPPSRIQRFQAHLSAAAPQWASIPQTIPPSKHNQGPKSSLQPIKTTNPSRTCSRSPMGIPSTCSCVTRFPSQAPSMNRARPRASRQYWPVGWGGGWKWAGWLVIVYLDFVDGWVGG
jgi:hypothetical protein